MVVATINVTIAVVAIIVSIVAINGIVIRCWHTLFTLQEGARTGSSHDANNIDRDGCN